LSANSIPNIVTHAFQDAVRRVTSASTDPLAAGDQELLATLKEKGWLPFEQAATLCPS